ncbi:VQ motif-containing protein [Tripterygium wilfordii]|uniref:VQ motif-containing protein n=1 Tax=Tripterygium wilfordii TaxID=458696 RepID=A0A7J7DMB8_TRIWF|nr:probable serine/threonine-protein kinase DDB_G0278665 [Tripterygium wilfordii]KAF5747364.1 VQ motif-containing protein [Tripterygium wilfordii]
MDSGNSGGSMQSSSGGDDEYDSRATDSCISAFFNSNNQQPQQPPHHHLQRQTHSYSSMFDPLSNFFDPLSRSAQPPPSFASTNSLLNLDMVWSRALRSEPDLGGFTASSSSPTQQFLTDQSQSRVAFPSNMPIPHRPENAPNNDHSTANNNTGGGTNMVRNPKKRSRASRRAPTTVLTTDTTNFRAMVQEFTGIPAPPFTSSPFPRTTRLDLFGASSSSSSPLPPYLLRPFAQKLQPVLPSFLSPSSSSSSSAIASATELTNINNINSSNINMQLQNPVYNFQSFLNQAPPKYNPLSNSAILGTKQQESLQINQSNDDSHLKMGVLEEFGLSTTALPRREISNGDPANWGTRDGMGSREGDRHHQHQGLLRSINGGNYNNPERVANNSNGKLNYSGGSGSSASDFHGEKGADDQNVATRTNEGMVESWICSSD